MGEAIDAGYGCEADKIPGWIFDWQKRREYTVEGQRWVTNGHVILAVRGEAVPDSEALNQAWLPFIAPIRAAHVKATIEARADFVVPPSRAYVAPPREGEEQAPCGEHRADYRCAVGPFAVALHYVCLVERLYGAVAWYAPSSAEPVRPVHALDSEGRTVAVVMPCAEPVPS